MTLIATAEILLGIAILCMLGMAVLRAMGYRVEFRLKAVRSRRRRHYEPDEHSQFF